MMRRRFLTGALIAAVAALASPSTSEATFTVTISDGVNLSATITDNVAGAPGDNGATTIANLIESGTFLYNGYRIGITAETNSPGGPVVGFSGNGAQLTNNVLTVETTGATAGPLTITVFSDGFTPFGGSTNAFVQNSLSTTQLSAGVTVSAMTELSPSVPTTTPVASLTGPPPSGTTSGLSLTEMTANLGSPFSVKQTLVFSGMGLDSRANITHTSTIAAPAPAGLILAATAVPFLGLIRRRMRKAETTTAA